MKRVLISVLVAGFWIFNIPTALAQTCQQVYNHLQSMRSCPRDVPNPMAGCIGFRISLDERIDGNRPTCRIQGAGSLSLTIALQNLKFAGLKADGSRMDFTDVYRWIDRNEDDSLLFGYTVRNAEEFTHFERYLFHFEYSFDSERFSFDRVVYFSDIDYDEAVKESAAACTGQGLSLNCLQLWDLTHPGILTVGGGVELQPADRAGEGEGEEAVERCLCGNRIRCEGPDNCEITDVNAPGCEDSAGNPACNNSDIGIGPPPPATSGVTLRDDFPTDDTLDQNLGRGGGTCQLNPLAAPQGMYGGWLVLFGLMGLRFRKKK